jgi:hypothetical protein
MAFTGGVLPSQYPEAQQLPNVRRFLAEQIDMQFADIRVLLRLPEPSIDPNVGANFTAKTAILGQISGFSIWFLHNRAAKRIETRERKAKAKMPYSGARFDTTSGMYAVNARAMPVLARPYTSGAPEVEAVFRLDEEGLRVDEVPVEDARGASGESRLQGKKALVLVLTVAGTLITAEVMRRRRK